jgi:hypothetical protein
MSAETLVKEKVGLVVMMREQKYGRKGGGGREQR